MSSSSYHNNKVTFDDLKSKQVSLFQKAIEIKNRKGEKEVPGKIKLPAAFLQSSCRSPCLLE